MGTRPYDYQIVHQKNLEHSPGCWNLHRIPRWTAERVENQGLRASRPITKYQIVHLFAYQFKNLSNLVSRFSQLDVHFGIPISTKKEAHCVSLASNFSFVISAPSNLI